MSIVDKSLKISLKLIVNAPKQKTWHFAYLYMKNKLISTGVNQPSKTHPFIMKCANRLNLEFCKNFPYIHAEIAAVSKCIGLYDLSDLKMVVIRLSKRGELRNSKPCRNCHMILSSLGINQIFHSTEEGIVES